MHGKNQMQKGLNWINLTGTVEGCYCQQPHARESLFEFIIEGCYCQQPQAEVKKHVDCGSAVFPISVREGLNLVLLESLQGR